MLQAIFVHISNKNYVFCLMLRFCTLTIRMWCLAHENKTQLAFWVLTLVTWRWSDLTMKMTLAPPMTCLCFSDRTLGTKPSKHFLHHTTWVLWSDVDITVSGHLVYFIFYNLFYFLTVPKVCTVQCNYSHLSCPLCYHFLSSFSLMYSYWSLPPGCYWVVLLYYFVWLWVSVCCFCGSWLRMPLFHQ